MEEVANIQPLINIPDTITKVEIDTHNWREVFELRKTAFAICQYKITEGYISAVFNKLKNHKSEGFYYKRGDNIMGFYIYYVERAPLNMEGIQAHNYMYAPLLCARVNDMHLGSAIITDMERHCRAHNLKYIRLHPSNKSLYKFYAQNGFIDAQSEPQLEMIKEIYPLIKITYAPRAAHQNKTAKRRIEYISLNSEPIPEEFLTNFRANIRRKYEELPE